MLLLSLKIWSSNVTNLILSDLSYHVDNAATQFENLEFPAFYSAGQPDDTPPLVEIPTLNDAHAAGKEKKEQKIPMLKRTNSWC
jgi:hypothetical protein